MTDRSDNNHAAHSAANLLDENEQLRTALETSLEENSRLVEDRDRLLTRVTTLSRELQRSHQHYAQVRTDAASGIAASERQSQSDEELRAAFEELQVLTEELEVANSGLQENNRMLDARVAERTRELRDANVALRATEHSFYTLANFVPDLLWRADATGAATWFNQRWFELTGQVEQEPLGQGWLDVVHPVDRPLAQTSLALAVDSGKPYERQMRIRDAQGAYRWFLIRAQLARDDVQYDRHWFLAGTDIHDQRLTLEELGRSEQRFRTLVEGMPQLVWRSHDRGDWTWSSHQWQAYTGRSAAQSVGLGWIEAFHPDDRDKTLTAWDNAERLGVFEVEARICHAEEAVYRHFRTRALPIVEAVGGAREWIGTSTDVDDIIQLQKRQTVLVAELQHRTRNLMAVVQAVTLRTLRTSTSLDHFRECIDNRLQALARVQGLLSRRGDGRVTFDALLHDELSAHLDLTDPGTSEHLLLSGPPGIRLPSAIVQTLALALHELATNAVKYGALSQRGARLTIQWSASDVNNDEQMLTIDWRETNVALPSGERLASHGGGYGRELIERALPYQLGATTSYTFTADGLHCAIAIQVPDDSDRSENSHE